MKKIIFTTLALLTMHSATFSQEGIKFLSADFGELLGLAELEGKIVFIDAYTDWCAPCKVMDKDVFSQKEVGDFFNTHFINGKINMEKEQGIPLAQKYSVLAYPSFLFVNYDGTIAHRYAGFKDPKAFLELGKLALDESNNLEAMGKKYEDGDRTADFLYRYLQLTFQGAAGNHVPILEAYLATQDDWSTPETKELIINLLDTPNSELFDYLVQHKSDFEATYGAASVTNKIQSLVYESLGRGTTPLEAADELFQRAYPENAKRLAAQYKMAYYQQNEDGAGFAKAAITYVKSFPTISLEELNDISWGFYDLVDDKADLKKALKWVKRSVKKDNSYLNNDTLAALYQKIGKKKKAEITARKAIAIAKASGEDYSATEELLEELKN